VRFLHDTCDPYLRLFRRVIPSPTTEAETINKDLLAFIRG
jgi:hypothetical protein